MKNLRNLPLLLLAPLLLPLQLGTTLLRSHTGRARTARAAGDRGALSIEMALIVLVVIGIAGAVLLVITQLATHVKDQVPATVAPPAPGT